MPHTIAPSSSPSPHLIFLAYSVSFVVLDVQCLKIPHISLAIRFLFSTPISVFFPPAQRTLAAIGDYFCFVFFLAVWSPAKPKLHARPLLRCSFFVCGFSILFFLIPILWGGNETHTHAHRFESSCLKTRTRSFTSCGASGGASWAWRRTTGIPSTTQDLPSYDGGSTALSRAQTL